MRGMLEKNQHPDKFLPVAKLKEHKSGMEVWNLFKSYATQHNAKLK